MRVVLWCPMHVDIVPNRRSRPAILLRETWREGTRVRKRTVANLTKEVTLEQALIIRRVLAGETLVAPNDAFEQLTSRAHGHVQAVLLARRKPTARWTGWEPARNGSRRSSRSGTCALGRWCASFSPRATSRASTASWRRSGTTATRSAARR